MSAIQRRHFLQLSGSFLAALELNQSQIHKQALQYGQALATDNFRKLALLVGINDYPALNALQGCITDIYLQQELLIHRFGFQKEDIWLIADDQSLKPTRHNILQAFEEHLIKQAKPNDLVVFHYSGHGFQVVDETEADGYNSTFVPLDRQTKEVSKEKIEVSDIMGHTLFLLMSALKTDRVTVVLDSCHSGGGTRGNVTIRSLTGLGFQEEYPSSEELDYQDRWLSKLGLSREEFIKLYTTGIAKGVVLAAAQENQSALDVSFDGFAAGAFTYALTQYLWQATGDYPLSRVMDNVGRGTNRIAQQNPLYEVKQTNDQNQPMYFLNPATPPSEGLIKQVTDNEVKLWLGGFNPQVLKVVSQDAIFEVLDQQGKPQGEVKVNSRQGLEATALPHKENTPQQLQAGNLIREKAIAIPEDFALHLALDDSLGVDKNAIKTAIEALDDRVKIVLFGEQVHYILGRMTPEINQQIKATETSKSYTKIKEIPVIGSIGLFSQTLEMIPYSFGEVNESIADLSSRLLPKLRSLLTILVVKSLFIGQENIANSPRLKVSATMTIETGNGQAILSSDDVNVAGIAQASIPKEGTIPLLKVNTKTQLRITNQENQDLYIAVLVLNPTGELGEYPLFPETWDAPDDAALFAAKQSFLINQSGKKVTQTSDYLTVQEPLGITEILVLASKKKLRKALISLQQLKSTKRSSRGGLDFISEVVRDTRGYGSLRDRSLLVAQIGSASLTFKAIDN